MSVWDRHCLHTRQNACSPIAGRSGLAVACLTAVREVLGSNRAVGSCVYRENHCDLQPWARAVCTLPTGALVVTHAMLRRLTSWRCIIIIIIITDSIAASGCKRYRVALCTTAHLETITMHAATTSPLHGILRHISGVPNKMSP